MEHVLHVEEKHEDAGEAEEAESQPAVTGVHEEQLRRVVGAEEEGEERQEPIGEDCEEGAEVGLPVGAGQVQAGGVAGQGQDRGASLVNCARDRPDQG